MICASLAFAPKEREPLFLSIAKFGAGFKRVWLVLFNPYTL